MNARICAVLLFVCAIHAQAASVTVTWDANTEPDIAGYRLFWGTQSGVYTNQIDVVAPIAVASNLQPKRTYFFAAIAYNTEGIESELSEEISYRVPRLIEWLPTP